jgi:hypothetical protein
VCTGPLPATQQLTGGGPAKGVVLTKRTAKKKSRVAGATDKSRAPRVRLANASAAVDKRSAWSPPREVCPKCGAKALPQPSFSRAESRWRCADRDCTALEWTTPRATADQR